MAKYISILRGINVGGKRKILMADLRALYKKLGFTNVTTYIQSGNVIFESKKKKNLEEIITKAIKSQYDFDVPVIIRTVEEWQTAFHNNTFTKDKNIAIERLVLTFLKEEPIEENLEKIKTYDYSPDKFHIIGREIFIYCEGKYHQTKLSNNFFEKKLKVAATTRNWKTVTKLLEMVNE